MLSAHEFPRNCHTSYTPDDSLMTHTTMSQKSLNSGHARHIKEKKKKGRSDREKNSTERPICVPSKQSPILGLLEHYINQSWAIFEIDFSGHGNNLHYRIPSKYVFMENVQCCTLWRSLLGPWTRFLVQIIKFKMNITLPFIMGVKFLSWNCNSIFCNSAAAVLPQAPHSGCSIRTLKNEESHQLVSAPNRRGKERERKKGYIDTEVYRHSCGVSVMITCHIEKGLSTESELCMTGYWWKRQELVWFNASSLPPILPSPLPPSPPMHSFPPLPPLSPNYSAAYIHGRNQIYKPPCTPFASASPHTPHTNQLTCSLQQLQ